MGPVGLFSAFKLSRGVLPRAFVGQSARTLEDSEWPVVIENIFLFDKKWNHSVCLHKFVLHSCGLRWCWSEIGKLGKDKPKAAVWARMRAGPGHEWRISSMTPLFHMFLSSRRRPYLSQLTSSSVSYLQLWCTADALLINGQEWKRKAKSEVYYKRTSARTSRLVSIEAKTKCEMVFPQTIMFNVGFVFGDSWVVVLWWLEVVISIMLTDSSENIILGNHFTSYLSRLSTHPVTQRIEYITNISETIKWKQVVWRMSSRYIYLVPKIK